MSLLHHRSLDLTTPANVTLWAGCRVGPLRASESTVNLLHLTLADEQFNSPLNPQSVCVLSNCSTTDPLRKGCFIFPSRGSIPLCPVFSLINYLSLYHQCPLFLYKGGTPFLEPRYLLFYKLPYCQQVSLEMFLIIALELELQLTTAANPGIPDHLIKIKGHRSSKAYIIYCMYDCSLVDNVRCLSTPLSSFVECRQIRAFLSGRCLPPAISLLTLWALASKAWHGGSWLGC